jgi:hypothetical protein
VRRLVPVLVVLALAGCGGSSTPATTAAPKVPSPAATVGQGAKTLYRGGPWAVVVDGHEAVALHLVHDRWKPDRSGKVRISILGPKPGSTAAAQPQLATELFAHSALAESAIWLDGRELLVKGGGLTATRGTIYGAPDTPLAPGTHVAVAYARTAVSATAVAWTFHVGS